MSDDARLEEIRARAGNAQRFDDRAAMDRSVLLAALDRATRERDEALQHACDECTDADGVPTGWRSNRVEGRHACVCLTETEAWQALHAKASKQEQVAAENWDRSEREKGRAELAEATLGKVRSLADNWMDGPENSLANEIGLLFDSSCPCPPRHYKAWLHCSGCGRVAGRAKVAQLREDRDEALKESQRLREEVERLKKRVKDADFLSRQALGSIRRENDV